MCHLHHFVPQPVLQSACANVSRSRSHMFNPHVFACVTIYICIERYTHMRLCVCICIHASRKSVYAGIVRYVCMHACSVCFYVRAQICTCRSAHRHTCSCTTIHNYACLQITNHTYKHTYIHTYMRTCIHTCIPADIHTYIHTYNIHTYQKACIHTSTYLT